VPEDVLLDAAVDKVINQSLNLKVNHYTSITEINKPAWDNIFEGKGSFDWEGLKMLETSFADNKLAEDNWDFDYVMINDNDGKAVVATFLTTALWKDDMLSPAAVSVKVEEQRLTNPYYLTSKVMCTGSLLTEGEHIYINKESPFWKDAMQLLFEKIYALQEENKSSNIVLRDFSSDDNELDTFLVDNGFFKITMPDNNVIENLDWESKEGFYQSLSKRSKRHFNQDVQRHEDKFDVKVEEDYSEENILYWYGLYLNVKNNNQSLNAFALPLKVFKQMLLCNKWEVLSLTIKKGFDFEGIEKPVAVAFCYKAANTYLPVIVGMNYTYNASYKTYKQTLYQLVLRAKALQCQQINLGFSAAIEKKKVGALAVPTFAYMQAKDSYNFQVLANMAINATG
jgi:hypothetical protein